MHGVQPNNQINHAYSNSKNLLLYIFSCLLKNIDFREKYHPIDFELDF